MKQKISATRETNKNKEYAQSNIAHNITFLVELQLIDYRCVDYNLNVFVSPHLENGNG